MDQLAAGSSLILYSFTLGLVAAVNPCGFPMLPAYLALFAGSRSGPKAARIAGALRSGASMSAGFVAAFGSLGLLLQGGAALVAGALPWLMMLVGVGMAVAGVFTIAGRGHRLKASRPGSEGDDRWQPWPCMGWPTQPVRSAAPSRCSWPPSVAPLPGMEWRTVWPVTWPTPWAWACSSPPPRWSPPPPARLCCGTSAPHHGGSRWCPGPY